MFQLHPVAQAAQPSESPLQGAALCVAFAEGDAITHVREAGGGSLSLEPPFSLSDEDTYLIVPNDIGDELVDILRDADHELLHEALRDSLVVIGEARGDGRGGMLLDVEQCRRPAELLAEDMAYGAEVQLSPALDVLRAINTLDHLQCTMLSALLDEDGLESVLRAPQYLGTSWRLGGQARQLRTGVDPTFVWSRRHADGSVGIEFALFVEDEELIAYLRPVRLRERP